jgi:hypothetical protein
MATRRCTRSDGGPASLLVKRSGIGALVIDAWVMAPVVTPRARLLGDLRGLLPDSLNDPDLATAGGALARADRRSHRRRHSQLTGS